ncbi:hypothetical protein LZ554_004146 [Drepanopeziza brunnea f. sp. 'monogermtubi']|nr:hypothetical protein LZ554_004146 [Drepanopeziza brunnea f. sp. 'monogermtubi']
MPDLISPPAIDAKSMQRRDMFQGMRWDLVDLQTTPWLNSTLEQLESVRKYWHAPIRVLLLGIRLVSNTLSLYFGEQTGCMGYHLSIYNDKQLTFLMILVPCLIQVP